MVLLILICILTAADVWAAPAPVKMDDGDTVTAQTDISVPDSAATLISASNSSRGSLNCTTDLSVRWGGSNVTITRGQSIPAGGTVAIHNTAAIYMIAESGTATVSCTEESHSASSGTGVFSP